MGSQELTLESRPDQVIPLLDQVHTIANAEKEALGFIPHGAYDDAAKQRRLLLATSRSTVVGFVLFGGVFPHARIQQIGVAPNLRRSGVASRLMRELLARLEKEGFLTVKARVAQDLPIAQAFYAKLGFEAAQTVQGGEARNRQIVIRVRHLETPSLLDAGGGAIDWRATKVPLALRRSSPGESPFYVIDLNVFFDLVRERSRSSEAHQLFSAALSHQLRIAVAGEFVEELRRTSQGASSDPLLKLALQLPRVPRVDDAELAGLAETLHKLIFERTGSKAAGTAQARSDAKHVAHAALARAAGFITSDQQILASREDLLNQFGIDVAGLEELASLLPAGITPSLDSYAGDGFICRRLSCAEARSNLAALGANAALLDEFCQQDGLNRHADRFGVVEGNNNVIAVCAISHPRAIDAPARLLVQVPQSHSFAVLFAEHLIEVGLKVAAQDKPVSIELCRLPGQTVVSRVAKAKGFTLSTDTLIKVALGRPMTPTSWQHLRAQVRRTSGVELPASIERGDVVILRDAQGQSHQLPIDQLEELLAPTVVAWPGREGVIVSIQRRYADELLGTSNQSSFAFVESRPAAFLSRRAYVCSPRNASILRVGRPLLFYESERSGGRGAIVAIGRIVDSLVQPKGSVSADNRRRLVVDDFDEISASNDVLVTTFDNLMTFPRPVTRRELADFNALGSSNLQTATLMTSENLSRVLDAAWT